MNETNGPNIEKAMVVPQPIEQTTSLSSSSPGSPPLQLSPPEEPVVGEHSLQAGFWAKRTKQCPWQKAIGPRKKPWEMIYALMALLAQREPTLQRERKASDFDNHVGQKKANIEALLAQTGWRFTAH
jgi:hypothetical protein